MQRAVAGLVGVVALVGLACSSSAARDASPSPPVERPVVRDDAGEVVSRLVMPDGAAAVTVPLVEEDGLLLTSAMRVNGKPIGWVAVDTGAGFSALDRETANALGFAPELRLAARRRNVEPPDGFYPIESLAVGEFSIANHAIVVADLSSLRRPNRRAIAGVIGGDVFGAVPFTIDYRKMALVLHARDSFRPPARRDVPARALTVRGPVAQVTVYDRANPHAGWPVMRVAINDVPADAALDTGFSGSVVLMPELVALHPEWVEPSDQPAARAAGAAGALGLAGRDLARARVDRLRAMGVTFVRIQTALALEGELPGVDDEAVLGRTVLSHFRLTFDYASGRLWAEYQPRPKQR